jgi:hypothetical protein
MKDKDPIEGKQAVSMVNKRQKVEYSNCSKYARMSLTTLILQEGVNE